MDKAIEAMAQAIYEQWENFPAASNRTWADYVEKLPNGAAQFRKKAQIARTAFLANTDGGEIVERLCAGVMINEEHLIADDVDAANIAMGEAADHITKLTAQGAADRERITELEAALRKLIDVADMTANDENTGAMDRTIEAARAALSGAQSPWREFPAPIYERILVTGWSEKSKRVIGYWWVHEDHTDENRRPIYHPTALLWQPFPSAPTFTPPGKEQANDI